ncbi:low-density lipoprotein receptor-related protein 3-like [Gigantopelta aegis]|uniref:low-density lipoprotein receptor-related protein 3-like n=1 Tax=Gigantopelta aegis TaxID=1735272 RepID=UPI001B88A240|nr:low-density lipoprotein receptor-related protein 3-like [Gigantopelta aegis]
MITQSFAAHRTYYMDEHCERKLILTKKNSYGILKLTKWWRFGPHIQCVMSFRAPSYHRMLVRINKMDLMRDGYSCTDWVQIYDGNSIDHKELSKSLCGKQAPDVSFASTGGEVTIQFVSNSGQDPEEFEMIFNSFYMAPCVDDDYECDNGRCIARLLQCTQYDHCGDNSSNCQLLLWIFLGIFLTVIVFAGIGGGIYFFMQKRKRKQAMEQLANPPPAPTGYPKQARIEYHQQAPTGYPPQPPVPGYPHQPPVPGYPPQPPVPGYPQQASHGFPGMPF